MAKVNREFGKPTEDSQGIEYAPVVLSPNPSAPTEAEYNAAGWYRITIEPPEPPEGMVVDSTRYEIVDSRLVAVYDYKDRPLPTIEDFDNAMEEHLLSERVERGYTTREPDAYLTSSVARWKKDAEDWVAHRDNVMQYALGLINAVESGSREPPTLEEFIEGLPTIEWSDKTV